MSENNMLYEIAPNIAQEKASLSTEVEAVIQEVSSHISIDPEVLAQDPLGTDTNYGGRIEEDPAFFETVKPFLGKVILAEELKDVDLPNGYGKIVLDSKRNTPQNYVSSLALTLAMSELPVQTIESGSNLPREEKLGDIISDVYPAFEEYRKDMERILELAITDKDRFLKEFSKEENSNVSDIVQRTLISQRVRAGLALSLGMAVALSACVQNGVVVTQPTSASEPVPITEIVDIPTETEAPATEVPTSTPTPIPTEAPEPTIVATEWPQAAPWIYDFFGEFSQYGYAFGFFDPYTHGARPEIPHDKPLVIALSAMIPDFYCDSLETTEEGIYLIGSIINQSKENKGEEYPLRVRVDLFNSLYFTFDEATQREYPHYFEGEDSVHEIIELEEHNYLGFFIINKKEKKPFLAVSAEDAAAISEEKWREARLLVNKLIKEGGSSDDYELVLSYIASPPLILDLP